METGKEFKTVKELVLNLLETSPRCRNDDKYLTYMVMRHFTNIYINFNDFEKIPSFETIKRTRAKIQNNEGLFPPTSETALKRRKRQGEVKQWAKGQ